MITKLVEVQRALKAPKNRKNSFGNYNYRSAEDILEAVKPLLAEAGLQMTVTDSLEYIGDRYYVKATVRITDGKETVEVSGYAREEEQKKGMDASQITGSVSSYARKYALNGMFLIDDNKDADTDEFRAVQENSRIMDGANDGLSKEQLTAVRERIKNLGAKEDKVAAHFLVEKLEDIPKSDFGKLNGYLNAVEKKLKVTEC